MGISYAICEDSESFFPQIRTSTPEERLVAAVLARAVFDLWGVSIPGGSHGCKKALIVLQAKRFFGSKSVEPWSFIWCCHHVGVDSDAFLKLLRQKLKEPKPHPRCQLFSKAARL